MWNRYWIKICPFLCYFFKADLEKNMLEILKKKKQQQLFGRGK